LLALRALGSAVTQLYRHAVVTLVSNVLSALLSLPIVALVIVAGILTHSVMLVPIGVAIFVGALPNPAAAASQYLAHLLAHGDFLTVADYKRGLKENFTFALRCWLLSAAVTIVAAGNAVFYLRLRTPFSGVLAVLWLFALFLWLGAQLYVYPLIMEQEVHRVVVVYRNALLVLVARPLYTLFTAVLWLAALVVVSGTGLVMIFGIALGSAIQQNAAAQIFPTFEAPVE
jgi:uncharacterized membrane protein YesL